MTHRFHEIKQLTLYALSLFPVILDKVSNSGTKGIGRLTDNLLSEDWMLNKTFSKIDHFELNCIIINDHWNWMLNKTFSKTDQN